MSFDAMTKNKQKKNSLKNAQALLDIQAIRDVLTKIKLLKNACNGHLILHYIESIAHVVL